MEANSARILAAGTAAAVFELVTDEVVSEPSALPAAVLYKKSWVTLEAIDTRYRIYEGEVDYHVWILGSTSWTATESNTDAFLKQVFASSGRPFRLVERDQSMHLIGGQELHADKLVLRAFWGAEYKL